MKIEIPYLLSALKSYPYFLLGDFVSRYGVIQKGWLRDSRTQTVAILGYVVAVYIRLFHPINIVNITGIFAITILMCMFARYSDRLPSWLDTIGKRSLEIYVLHWFFLPKFPELGTWITGTGSFNENFVITVLLCTVVCLPIIAACMVIATVIEQSDILNFLCFGIRKKAQERIQIPKQS